MRLYLETLDKGNINFPIPQHANHTKKPDYHLKLLVFMYKS